MAGRDTGVMFKIEGERVGMKEAALGQCLPWKENWYACWELQATNEGRDYKSKQSYGGYSVST